LARIDVIILGGGPAGSATALALARSGLSALIVERTQYDVPRIGETLPPAIKPLLVSLDVWESFLRDAHASSPAVQSAWGSDELYSLDHIYNPYGPGWHVDRARFDQMLASRAGDAGVSVLTKAELLSCLNDSIDNWQIEISCNDRKNHVEARFVVDATGRSSFFAGRRGIRRIAVDHLVGVVGIVKTVNPETACEYSTLIEASEEGWWYSARLPDARLVLSYMTDADLYAKGQRQNPDYWSLMLKQTIHTRSRISGFDLSAWCPRVVSANSSRLAQTADRNWLAVGDAAIAFDPLAGQGIYKAIESGLLGAKVIKEHLSGNGSTSSAIGDYVEARNRDFTQYLHLRHVFYARENRWPQSLFWQRRALDPDLNNELKDQEAG
jgi:flavin-dependent dehydrogenase